MTHENHVLTVGVAHHRATGELGVAITLNTETVVLSFEIAETFIAALQQAMVVGAAETN